MANEIQKIITPEFRVAFANVFAPRNTNLDNPDAPRLRYGVTMIFEPKENLVELQKIANTKVKADFGENFSLKSVRHPFRKQAEKHGIYEGFNETGLFVNCTTKNRPQIITQDGTGIFDEEGFYSGCYARASLTVFTYDQKGKGVGFGLKSLLKTRDGEPLGGGRASAEQEFEAFIDAGEHKAEADELPGDIFA